MRTTRSDPFMQFLTAAASHFFDNSGHGYCLVLIVKPIGASLLYVPL
jgi:hypothetical protein